MDGSVGDPICSIRHIHLNWFRSVLLCSGTILYERPGGWHPVWTISSLFDVFPSDIIIVQDEICGLGNRYTELWVLAFTNTSGIHGCHDHSFCCGDEVVQEEKERRCVT